MNPKGPEASGNKSQVTGELEPNRGTGSARPDQPGSATEKLAANGMLGGLRTMDMTINASQKAQAAQSLLDMDELSKVDISKLSILQDYLKKLTSPEGDSFNETMKDPEQLKIFAKHLNEAKEQLKKMVGAEITNPIITEPLKKINALMRILESVEAERKQPAPTESPANASIETLKDQVKIKILGRIGELSGQIIDDLEAAQPFCEDKVKDAQKLFPRGAYTPLQEVK